MIHCQILLYKEPSTYTATSERVILSLFSPPIFWLRCDHEATAPFGMKALARVLGSAEWRGGGVSGSGLAGCYIS